MKIENNRAKPSSGLYGYSKLKIIFFGTPDFAMPVLKALLNSGYNVSHFKSKTLKDDKTFETFKLINPDVCIVAAYGKILPPRYLEIPKFGFLNIHPSVLPKYKGPSPVQTAIINGDKETGVSIIIVDEQVDHGPVIAVASYKIPNSKNNIEISNDLFCLGGQLLVEILPKYINGQINSTEQNHDQATFTKMFQRKDGRINWDESAKKIYNQIRALNPEPGTWTTWKDKVINISNITTRGVVGPQVINIADLKSEIPGKVRKIGTDIVIKTETGYLILKSVQLEGGKEMDAKSFVNGHSDFLNSTLE